MNSILVIAFREFRIRLTNPILPLWDVVVPVVYLVVFGASVENWIGLQVTGFDYPTFFLGGVLSMVTFSIAMNCSYAFFEDLQSGIFYELLTYPFARRDLLLGKLLFNAIFGLVGALACVAAGVGILHIHWIPARLPALSLCLLLGTAGWYFLFSWLALKVRGFNAYHTTTSSLYLLLMFVSNLFYPADRLPAWLGWLARANPITWETDLLRYFTYGAGDVRLLQFEAAGFVVFTLFCYWLANHLLNQPME